MSKYNSIYKFILTLILLCLLWISLFFLIFSSPKQKISLKQFLPDNVDMVISINMHQLISTLFIDATYKTEVNSYDLKLLRSKNMSKDSPFKGIDFNSEIVFFYDSWKDSFVKGFFFNLSDAKAFNKKELSQKNIVKASNDQRGLLIYLDKNASQNTIDHYTAFAQNITSKKPNLSDYSSPMGIMNLSFKGNKFSYIQDLALNIQLDDEHLLIKGTGRLDSILPLKKIAMIEEPLNKKYFEIQSGKLPDSVFQRVDELAQKMSLTIPEIASQQTLIYGISIVKINSTPLVLPKMDCILRFDTIVHLDTLIKNINKGLTPIKTFENHLEIKGHKYYYQQLSENEIYIGVSKSPQIEKVQARVLPLTRGFPSAVLDIEGDGIIATIINLMPQVKNTKLFLKDVDYYDIHSDFIDNNNLDIVGEIRLEKGKMMSIGLAEFILKFLK